ncbi:MAG TPA: DUF3386 domain-containing protein [Halomicronema sp.]
MTEQNQARDLFKAAYENRYTWDSNFPGYSADIELKQGDEVYRGQIRINGDMSVEVTGIEGEEISQSVYTQLRDIVTHRKRNSFEESHSKNSFTLGETDNTGASEILVKGDSMGSNYKIRGTEICQVSRVMGRVAFVIDTYETLDTGNGYVATGYNVVFRNPQTNEIIAERQHKDSFEKFGNYYLMTQQVINAKEKGQEITTEFNFNNIKLLVPATV